LSDDDVTDPASLQLLSPQHSPGGCTGARVSPLHAGVSPPTGSSSRKLEPGLPSLARPSARESKYQLVDSEPATVGDVVGVECGRSLKLGLVTVAKQSARLLATWKSLSSRADSDTNPSPISISGARPSLSSPVVGHKTTSGLDDVISRPEVELFCSRADMLPTTRRMLLKRRSMSLKRLTFVTFG